MVSIDDGGGIPDTDSFAVYLLDATTLDPLIAYPSVEWFYYIDNSSNELMVPSANVVGNTVTLDLMDLLSYAGQDVLLAFEFSSDPDGWTTTVALDNVNVSVIPAPAALGLGLIGTGLVSLLRRTKKMQ
jgi:hypothetical protein